MTNSIIPKIEDIDPSHTDPTGDPSVGYPQICIRTNRTAQRTNLEEIIKTANSIADKYPDDKKERAKKVIEGLYELFESGNIGHAWIIIFNSEKNGDYSSYSYQGYKGYVHNGDNADRGFSYQHIFPINKDKINTLENIIIPGLNYISEAIGYAMGFPPSEGYKGVYTPITNCSWFAGNVWNCISSNSIDFTQPFSGKDYAKYWGIDALYFISDIADPGVIAESLAK